MLPNHHAPSHAYQARPCALTVAGLDPSGGAGMAADLRAFGASGAWGCAVCAAITVQSTAGLVACEPVNTELVARQAREVLAHENVRAIKSGALGSASNVRLLADLLREHPNLPSVVDPVMIATRAPEGARLLDPEALQAMRELLAVATVVTPNIDEAEALLDTHIGSVEQLADAARELHKRGAFAALVKGGHLADGPAVDMLALGDRVLTLSSERIEVEPFHGGGCTMASLIAGRLAARGGVKAERDVVEAVRFAKRKLSASIAHAERIGEGLLVLSISGE